MRTLIQQTDPITRSFSIPGGVGFVFLPTEPYLLDYSQNPALPGSMAAGNGNEVAPGVYPLSVTFPGEPDPLFVAGPNVYRFARPFSYATVLGQEGLDLWRVVILEEGDVYWQHPLSPRRGYERGSDLLVGPMVAPSGLNNFPHFRTRGLIGWEAVCRYQSGALPYQVEVCYASLGAGATDWEVTETLDSSSPTLSLYREVRSYSNVGRIHFRVTSASSLYVGWLPMYLG